MDNLYDIGIIGSGPAGLSAAINGKIRNKKVIIFGNMDLSPKLTKAPKINNYLGFYDISGKELKENFLNHLNSLDIEIKSERIDKIYSMGEYFALSSNDKFYNTKTLILAPGIEFTKSFKGEEELLGNGVGYCATCDAPLYRGKNVAVIGYNEEAEEEANYVKEFSDKLYYIPMYENDYNLTDNIEIYRKSPLGINSNGDQREIVFENDKLSVDGIFILRDSIKSDHLMPGLDVDENGHIKVNRNLMTNIKGCFAAGDCTGKPYQYNKAAGEGQVAALNAVNYLNGVKM